MSVVLKPSETKQSESAQKGILLIWRKKRKKVQNSEEIKNY